MYSLEDRIKAVKLYIKYGKSAAAVIRELGYPNRHSLASWYKEYVNTNGNLPAKHERKGKFTKQDRYCKDQYANPEQPEEFPTAAIHTEIRKLPLPASNLSFEKFNFDKGGEQDE